MNVTEFIALKPLKTFQFWLLGTAAGLAAIHLTLTWRADNVDLLGSSLLFLFVIYSSISDRIQHLKLNSGLSPSVLGIVLIAFLLLRSWFRPTEVFLFLFPMIAGVAIALLASGFQGIRQYRRELILLGFLGIPKVVVPILFDPTPFTAQLGTAILHYTGFQVYRDGLMIHLPTGSVEVYEGCSGIDSMTHVLSLSGLFLIMVSVGWGLRLGVPLLGMAIAFIVNGFRVALMAHLIAAGQREAFDYWHEGTGSLIFSMIAVVLFGGFCFGLMRWLEYQAETRTTEADDEADMDEAMAEDWQSVTWQEESE